MQFLVQICKILVSQWKGMKYSIWNNIYLADFTINVYLILHCCQQFNREMALPHTSDGARPSC